MYCTSADRLEEAGFVPIHLVRNAFSNNSVYTKCFRRLFFCVYYLQLVCLMIFLSNNHLRIEPKAALETDYYYFALEFRQPYFDFLYCYRTPLAKY